MNFGKFEFLTFDCYGTLIDWETGILEALKPILARHRKSPTDLEILARRSYWLMEYGNIIFKYLDEQASGNVPPPPEDPPPMWP